LSVVCIVTVMGTISSANFPSRWPAAVRCLREEREGILALARDAVALRDDLRGLPHWHVDVLLMVEEPWVLEVLPV